MNLRQDERGFTSYFAKKNCHLARAYAKDSAKLCTLDDTGYPKIKFQVLLPDPTLLCTFRFATTHTHT